jgi:hypothetical protein
MKYRNRIPERLFPVLPIVKKILCTMYISLTIFLFRSGIAFYFHLFSTVQVTVRPKKIICVFMVTCQKNLMPWASEVVQDLLTPVI